MTVRADLGNESIWPTPIPPPSVRWVLFTCGHFFDIRGLVLVPAHFGAECDGLSYIPLTVWRRTESLTRACPWCARKGNKDGE